MIQYSNWEVEVLKPSKRDCEHIRNSLRLRPYKIWCGTSVGMKKVKISDQSCAESNSKDIVEFIKNVLKSYNIKKKLRISIKSYISWEEKDGKRDDS